MLAQRPVVSLSPSFAPGRIEQIEVLAIRYGDFDGREGYAITSEVFTLTSQGAIHSPPPPIAAPWAWSGILARVGWMFNLTATAYNLVRLPKLVGAGA
jgi:hypothetical protein